MANENAAETVEHQKGILGLIERAGNRLPDPVFIFLYLIIAMALISQVTAWIGLAVDHPTRLAPDGEPAQVEAISVFSAAALQHLLVEMPEIFTGFHPLGYVLVVMLGVPMRTADGRSQL